jgi:hypothetical protein
MRLCWVGSADRVEHRLADRRRNEREVLRQYDEPLRKTFSQRPKRFGSLPRGGWPILARLCNHQFDCDQTPRRRSRPDCSCAGCHPLLRSGASQLRPFGTVVRASRGISIGRLRDVALARRIRCAGTLRRRQDGERTMRRRSSRRERAASSDHLFAAKDFANRLSGVAIARCQLPLSQPTHSRFAEIRRHGNARTELITRRSMLSPVSRQGALGIFGDQDAQVFSCRRNDFCQTTFRCEAKKPA